MSGVWGLLPDVFQFEATRNLEVCCSVQKHIGDEVPEIVLVRCFYQPAPLYSFLYIQCISTRLGPEIGAKEWRGWEVGSGGNRGQ